MKLKNVSWQVLRTIARSPRFDPVRRWVGSKILHCLGDSHVLMFRELAERRLLRRTSFRVRSVGGATALGMVNPKSQTNALLVFEHHLRSVSPLDHVLFLLGEVDCGYLIWYRAVKHGLSVETQFETSLSNYKSFVETVLARGLPNVVICSAPLPTISDGAPVGDVADARWEVRASLRERTDLTLRYNAELRNYAVRRQVRFLDFEPDTIDPETRTVKKELLNPDPLDHHLSPAAIAPVLSGRLRELGFR